MTQTVAIFIGIQLIQKSGLIESLVLGNSQFQWCFMRADQYFPRS